MDADSSRKEVVIKTRKPYTIMKQRERWTEEEHSRFLEALRLYGRTWQRIEEHIGTKTAVQIRSHAQKFFSKLEKESVVKGVPIGESIDIEIPPPRPKRKPSNPYPRKTNTGLPTSQIRAKDGKIGSASSLSSKSALDLLKNPFPEITYGEERSTTLEQNKDENRTKVFPILLESPFSSVSSSNKVLSQVAESLRNSSALREFIPSVKEVVNANETNGSVATIGHKQLGEDDVKQAENCNSTSKASSLTSLDASQVKLAPHEKTDDLNCPLITDDIQRSQNYPRHVPLQVLDGSLGAFTQFCSHVHSVGDVDGEPSLFADSAVSNASEIQNNGARFTANQSLASNPHLAPVPNIGDDCQSFLHVSSMFSNLIVSTLLQNPATQSAASFAATFWPYANMETPANSPACSPGDTSRQMGSTPSMEAIVAATVAAATAWWAANGLLTLCAPLHTAFMCAPAPAGAMASIHTTQAAAAKIGDDTSLENPPLQEQLLDPEHSEATQGLNSASKSPAVSLSESEENGGAKGNAVSAVIEHEKATAVAEHNDSNKVKGLKQVDLSSCGSNTPSCSEVETDALPKDKKEKDDPETAEAIQSASDSINRQGRTSSNGTDSWKEVSEEGRLAFQALFTRELLPQCFSPPDDLENKGHQKETIQENHQTINHRVSTLDINSKKRSPDQQEVVKSLSLSENGDDEGKLTIGIGQGKLKLRRTVFKPYKRCSVEVKENRAGHPSNQSEEKIPKGMCLEGGLQLDIHVTCDQR